MAPEEKDPQAAAAAAPPPPEANAAAGEKEEDPERKKKKEEKVGLVVAREKELKKQKAAEKAAKAKAAAAAAASAEPSKKAEAKAKKAAAAAAGGGAGEEADAANPPTEPGQKKKLAKEMAKAYNPKAVEASWYEWWEQAGFFKGDNQSTKPPFVIVVPPPNVTGALHIGHGLTAAVEDTIVRWKRMSGYNVCWVPGTDHAGIATQVVVEKKLMREKGLSRHDVGREDFVKEVWKWKEDYGGRVGNQQRKMGASLDWSRECFTMDDKLSRAVTEAFVRLHDQGLIYRDNRLINWDCVLRTVISDIEVEYHELKGRTLLPVPGYEKPVEFGAITSFAYPLEADSAQGEGAAGAGSEGALTEIVVATTRPETMLGDTAVAVHPDDPRYKALHGKFAVHPFSGRRIPIMCDAELVDMAFGTGAVKITPAHDPNDFATGKRHNLEFINIFTDDGLINANGGKEFEGMKRFDARTAVLEKLQEKGLYRGVADNPMRLGFCSRSKDIIEPMLKPQWYVSCADVAADACQAVRDGQLEFIPKAHEETWFRWLENIRDWCISRQLWRGHRIPAWYVTFDQSDEAAARDFPVRDFGAYNTNWVVARTDEDARRAAEKKFPGRKFELGRDPDVLDTWFSSGLFPFSGNVIDPLEVINGITLQQMHPTDSLSSPLNLPILPTLPQVYLHAMVRDAHGRKMSKSLGNVIDPLEVINGITLQQLQANLEKGNLDPREVKKAQAGQAADFPNGIADYSLQVNLEKGNLDPREVKKAQAGQAADFPNGIAECGCDALRFALVNYTTQRVHGYLSPLLQQAVLCTCDDSLATPLPRLFLSPLCHPPCPPNPRPRQWMNINLDIQRVHGYRLWCNKLWNAIRFAMLNLGDSFTPPSVLPQPSPSSSDSSSSPALTPTLNFAFSAPLPLSCRWILSVLNAAVTRAVTALEGYDLAEATNAAYAWWQYQLCDVFIEVAKPAFNAAEGEEALKLKQVGSGVTALEGYDLAEAMNAAYVWWQYQLCDVFIEVTHFKVKRAEVKRVEARAGEEEADGLHPLRGLLVVTREVLWVCLDAGLRLLHPFMPFVTEELWQRLPKPADYSWPSIMLAPYPSPVKEWADPDAEAMMATAESAVRSIRSLRMAYALQPKQRPTAYAQCKSEAATAAVTAAVGEIKTLATLAELQVLPAGEAAPAGCAVAIVDESLSVHVLLRGMVDAKAEAQKLGKRKNETAKGMVDAKAEAQRLGKRKNENTKLQEALAKKRRCQRTWLQEALAKKMGVPGYEEKVPANEALAKKMGVPGYEEKVPANVREENASKAAKLAAELASIDEAIKNFEKLMLDESSA
ncbi:unnamed protein product [Closterium sp. Naga37s-1]|nr:unnamed protein product [Closterium sp. Naga37s-1]